MGVSPGASAPPSSFSGHLGAEGILWRDLGRTRGRSCSVRWETVRRRTLPSWGPEGQVREVTVRQVGVWGEGGWTRDTPLRGQLVYCGARRESSPGPAHLHGGTALDFRPWRGRWDSAQCPGSSVILPHPFQPCCVEEKPRPREATGTWAAGQGIQVLRRPGV